MSDSPIFIHSLFRAGSTYLFDVFRRSEGGFWCYQEPLHEIAVYARGNPTALLEGHGDEKARQLRHPLLAVPYFQELVEVSPAWESSLTESAIYDGYFAPEGTDFGIPYWRALIAAAKGRPMFQECRTASRVGAIKRELGGIHIYLWRNPWDQWWSCKVHDYFGAAIQLIVNAQSCPDSILALRQLVSFQKVRNKSIGAQFSHFYERPLSAENSFLVFYLLWCLGMQEGRNHADLLLNIDRMSESTAYRADVTEKFEAMSICGLDFSDCLVPQARYFEEDKAFFVPLEEQVHSILLRTGWTDSAIEKLSHIRRANASSGWGNPLESIEASQLVEDVRRARSIALRFETSLADVSQSLLQRNEEIRQAGDQLGAKLQSVTADLTNTHQALATTGSELDQTRQALVAKESELDQTQQALAVAQSDLTARDVELAQTEQALAHGRVQLTQVYRSWSWRVTSPARFVVRKIYSRF